MVSNIANKWLVNYFKVKNLKILNFLKVTLSLDIWDEQNLKLSMEKNFNFKK